MLQPVLVILTLPVTVVTVGLFYFVINALVFWAAAGVLDGFPSTGFGAALLGSLSDLFGPGLVIIDQRSAACSRNSDSIARSRVSMIDASIVVIRPRCCATPDPARP